MNNKTVNQIDFLELINILKSGIWIILTFSILGLFIGYVYHTNFEYYEGEVQYEVAIPLYEVGTIDKLKLSELNYSIKQLYSVEYEKSLLNLRTPSAGDMFSQSGGFGGSIDITSRGLMGMVVKEANNDSFIEDVRMQFNSLIEKKYKGDDEKIKKNRLNYMPSFLGSTVEAGNALKYVYITKFAEPYIKGNAEEFANIVISNLRYKINRELNVIYKIAEEHYFKEVESILKSINYLMKNLENDYASILHEKIENLKFQKKVALDLGYRLPVTLQHTLDVGTTEVRLTEDTFAKGYVYLEKKIKNYEKRLNKDYTPFIPELRSYQYAYIEISQHTTLKRVRNRIKKFGLFDNEFKVFNTPIQNEFIYQESSNPLLTITKTDDDNMYASVFGLLIGIVFGVFLTFVIFFYKNNKRS